MSKPKRVSPSQRSLAYLRQHGYTCQIVERWNSFAGVRQDLFGCIDVLAVRCSETLGIQITTMSNLQQRIRKVSETAGLLAWLSGGRRQFWVMAWRKLKVKRGGKAVRWEVAIRQLDIGANCVLIETEVAA